MNYQNISESKLKVIAQNLAKTLKSGDVILLRGDLGAGKTTFAKYLIHAIDSSIPINSITSPTFNLVHIYNTKIFNIWHFDLYRIKKINELYQLGIEDAINSGISLIEWPDIALEILPKNPIKIDISVVNNKLRNILII